jgi:gliding motility-associated-like protein
MRLQAKFLLTTLLLVVSHLIWAHQPDKSVDFIENQGQWPSDALFNAPLGGLSAFFEKSCFTFTMVHPEDLAQVHASSQWSNDERNAWQLRSHVWKVNFDGANPNVNVVGQNTRSHYYNYFLGDDQSKWAGGVPAHAKIRYLNLWNGIDLIAYASRGQLKYDFIIDAGGNTDLIQLEYEGIETMDIVDGNLVLTTSVGNVIEQAPYAYQMNGTSLEEVEAQWVLDGHHVSFFFPNGFDTSKKLVIDPLVIASTMSGTTGNQNYGHSAAYDIAGNIYTGAISFGSGYPTTTGAFQESFSGGGWGVDIALSRLNPDGTDLIYATYLGGGSGDYPHSLIVNDFGELYVYGSTDSVDFPTTDDAYSPDINGSIDIVVTHFTEDATGLIGSTFMGGSESDGRNLASVNYGDTYRGEIILDINQNPMVASFSSSSDFPTTAGAYQTTIAGMQDAVAFSLNQELTSLTWSTLLGSSENDSGLGIRQTINGDIYLAGMAGDDSFPVTAGAYQTDFLGQTGDPWNGEKDGFVARFSPGANDLLACTFFGTEEEDQVFFIDLDNDENVWVYGQSRGIMPVIGTDLLFEEEGTLFISKFAPNLDDLLVSAIWGAFEDPWGGGGYAAVPVAFLVDRCDNVYISGYNAQAELTLTDDAVYDTGGFYLAAFGENITTLEFGSYYGANHVDGGTSRFDKNGIIYQGVCSGGDFPTLPDAWAPDQFTGWDIGVLKMDFQVSGVNAAITADAEDLNGCAPHTVNFSNYSVGNIFTWNFGDGSPETNEFEPSYTYTEPGVFQVSLISADSLSCNLADTAYIEIHISIPTDFQAAFSAVLDCETMSVICTNETGIDWLYYQWDMGDGTLLEGVDVTHVYGEEGDFTITLNAIDEGCEADDEAQETIQVIGNVLAEIGNEDLEGCGEMIITFDNLSNGLTYLWDFGDGSPTTTETAPTHIFTGPGIYEVTLTAYHPESCNLEDEVVYTVGVGAPQDIESAFQLVQTDCDNFLVEGTNLSTGDYLAFEWDMGDGNTYEVEDVMHNYDVTGMYDVTLTITDTLCNIVASQTLSVNILSEVTAIIGNDNLEGCDPYLAEFQNNSAGSTFEWNFGDGSTIEYGSLITHLYTDPGEYLVTLIVEGTGNCGGIDTTTAWVTVNETPYIEALFDVLQIGACEAQTIEAANQSIGDGLFYEWDVDGAFYNTPNIDHVFGAPGTYSISLTIIEPTCDATSTYTQQVEVLQGIDFTLQDNLPLCYNVDGILLDAGDLGNASFEWSNGETSSETFVTEPGIYTVTATLNNCTDTEGVTVFPVNELDINYTLWACEGTQAMLEIPHDNGSNYQWCSGEQIGFIYASEPGEYCFSFNDEFGCYQASEVTLEHVALDASVYIPNAFTPNNDGINDIFKPEGADVRYYEFVVWNRWGQKVFESADINEFWDGSYNHSEHYVQDGLYTYRVVYNSNCSSEKLIKTGYVNLMR